ncbi:hypothetical protein DYBT9275_00949 [Dyadobacter sp. CECT 9275]|uniref:Cytochrome c domain-containing protein n=1 Tax=Dyadobacter helix TaxID=2822344 RepID=A0A916J9K4_9BACT|nr:c-type cytochrome [Dyadobacter sp. CECT 9275]CAG4992373.1 hypothetical protein DYBT9275_00949 [Dyadobacter sp. CECT 9275]
MQYISKLLIVRKFSKVFFFMLPLFLNSCEKSDTDTSLSLPKISVDENPGAKPLSPEKTMKSIRLPEGYHLELVASEPMITEPVAIAWDGNGRMFVAQMQTYMQDINATNENLPVSQILLLEDTDNDGKMDKKTVYIDSLVLPRMMLPLDDRLIVGETYSNNLFSYRDKNGDGQADEKLQVYKNDTRDNWNLEHQKSGLIWNVDNYIYVSTGQVRYRFDGTKMIADSLPEGSRGQWGLTHDNYGRLFYSLAGGEIPAMGFQQNPAYGDLEFYMSQWEKGFEQVWPILSTPDVEGGVHRLREDSTLNHFSASCGQSVFRGDRLPGDLIGDLLICEPVGRLIRRAKVMNTGGKRMLRNAYQDTEFLASTDMNFRPVNTATGPDGNLYIVDMYRGIIQEGTYTGPSSYIRPQILKKGLDKNVGRGRIYRLVHDGYNRGSKPQMLDQPSTRLVQYLSHPNGWWRDNAQKLLILRNAREVIAELRKVAACSLWDRIPFFKNNNRHLGKIHALWTLDGLGALDQKTLFEALEDPDTQVRRTAVRLSENYLRKSDQQVLYRLAEMQTDPDVDVRTQLALSLRYFQTNTSRRMLETILKGDSKNEMIVSAVKGSLGKWETVKEIDLQTNGLSASDKALIQKGAVIFKQLCATCHGSDGKGLQLGETGMAAPPLAGSPRVRGEKRILIKILLSGLTGPVDGKTYPGIMPEMQRNDDDWIAAVASYIRTNLGNNSSVITTEELIAIKAKEPGHYEPWTLKELGLKDK